MVNIITLQEGTARLEEEEEDVQVDEDGVEALEVEELLLQPQPTLLYATGEIQSDLVLLTVVDMANAASFRCSDTPSMLDRYPCALGPIYLP